MKEKNIYKDRRHQTTNKHRIASFVRSFHIFYQHTKTHRSWIKYRTSFYNCHIIVSLFLGEHFEKKKFYK